MKNFRTKKMYEAEKQEKRRVKLYKAGKFWIAAALTTSVFGVSIFGLNGTAQADTTDADATTTTTVSTTESSTDGKSQVLKSSTSESLQTDSESAVANATSTANEANSTNGATPVDASSSSATTASVAESETTESSNEYTSQDATKTSSEKVTNLGDVSNNELSVAKKTAAQDYQTTGQAQKVTAVKAAVTASMNIHYVDKDTGEAISFPGYLINQYGTTINGVVTATTTAADPTKMKPSFKLAGIELPGYKFVGYDTDNLYYSATEVRDITAYYEKMAPILVQYVDEDDTSKVLYQFEYDFTKGTYYNYGDNYDFSYFTPDIVGYTYDAAATDQSALTGQLSKTVDDTNGGPAVIQYMYKRDPSKIIPQEPAGESDTTGATNFSGTGIVLPANVVKTFDGQMVVPDQYAGLTLLGSLGYGQTGAAAKTTMAFYKANEPVTVNFIDVNTNELIATKTLGKVDYTTGELPIGDYDTSSIKTDEEASGDLDNYVYVQTVGNEKGTYNPIETVVNYYYAVKKTVTVLYWDDTEDSKIADEEYTGGVGAPAGSYVDETISDITNKLNYEFVSNGVPDDLEITADEPTFYVHFKHRITKVPGDDPNATDEQKKTVTINVVGSTEGTDLTPEQVTPTGNVSQNLLYTRSAAVDETLKTRGLTVAEYTTYTSNWQPTNTMTTVTAATPQWYTPNTATVDLTTPSGTGTLADNVNQMVQTDDNAPIELTVTIKYAPISYTIKVNYVDSATGDLVSGPFDVKAKYGDSVDYPLIAPDGYLIASGDTKVVLAFDGKTTEVNIPVNKRIDTQHATVNYYDAAGKLLGSEAFAGKAGNNIAFDTVDYVATNFAKYKIIADETATAATFDENNDSVQSFKVTLDLKDVTTPLVPTGTDGTPIPGTTPTKETGKPGEPISKLPSIPGYTPISGQTPKFPTDDGTPTPVYYAANEQLATVRFVDQDGHVLRTQTVKGDSDSALDHSLVKDSMQAVINNGYNLVSDGTVGATFDHDDDRNQTFTITFNKIAADETNVPGTPTTTDTTPTPTNTPTPTDTPTPKGDNPVATNNVVVPKPEQQDTTKKHSDHATAKAQIGDSEQTVAKQRGNLTNITGNAKKGELPQTNESSTSVLALIGLSLLSLLGLAGTTKKRRD